MGVNRGKAFEDVVRRDFSLVDDCSIDRIHDQTNGFAGSSNICDFMVYKYPNLMYLECKSCYGNTFNLHNLTHNQFIGLKSKLRIPGVVSGVMIWFIDHDVTTFYSIDYIDKLMNEGKKSIRFDDIENGYVVPGTKKRIFFNYDMKAFLQELFYGKR